MDDLTTPSSIRLMALHLDALYAHDSRGRMTAINEWTRGIPPFLHLGRTREGNLWRVRADLPDRLAAQLETLCRQEPPLDDPKQPPHCQTDIQQLLERYGEIQQTWSGPAYALPAASGVQTNTVLITPANADLLRGSGEESPNGFEDWLPDVAYRQPFLAVTAENRAVALCASVRITPPAHEAGVETLPAFRRRGYAVAAVAAWGWKVRGLGAQPLYSTSWQNHASQAVAERLGARFFGADFHWT